MTVLLSVFAHGLSAKPLAKRYGAGAGAGAGSGAAVADRYRVWLEGYGMGSHTDAQADFSGDRRTTYGGLAAPRLRSCRA